MGDVIALKRRSVSVDRIDCSRGYLCNNVALVCRAANKARGDASLEGFAIFIDTVRRS